MRVIVDVGHPAVVHLYVPIVHELERRGHEVRIVSRDKDLTAGILDELGFSHTVLSRARTSKPGMFLELLEREWKLLREAIRFRPDLITGTSVNAARVAKMVGARSAILNEDDALIVPLFRWSAYPFATAIITPDVLAFENYGERHFTYPAFEKLLYLHPNRFTPAKNVPDRLREGSPDSRYTLFRFSALLAHHDAGARGLSFEAAGKLVKHLASTTNVWISSERTLPEEWERYRYPLPIKTMHSALSEASVLLTDSQSMSVEAAMLGVKAIRLNSFVGRLSVLNDLDERGLTEGFLPGDEGRFLERIAQFLENRAAELEGQKKRHQKLLEDKIDPLPWMVDLLESLGEGEDLSSLHARFNRVPESVQPLHISP